MTNLLKKEIDFEWKKEHQISFDQLREALIKDPILCFPNFTIPFIVSIDASKTGLGAILSQQYDNGERIVCFASRVTTRYEKNYHAYELEGLSLIFALKIWRCYLLGVKFLVRTDSNALTFIREIKILLLD